ncbi:MAG: InlB B-repeat-containing protein [Spirochaetaceae bacterium]|jgi:hypothetical protein|nr:InlB B-repeat-containing protein [Spirochaetaceae bacterium]
MKKKSRLFTDILIMLGLLGCRLDYVAPQLYRVTYDPNGGSGPVPVDEGVYPKGDFVTILKPKGLINENFVFLSWNTEPDGAGTEYIPGTKAELETDLVLYAVWKEPASTRQFQAQDLTDHHWYEVSAVQLAESEHCLVFADIAEEIPASIAEAIALEYETAIFPVITEAFGDIKDVDHNGKVILLLLDIRDGYTGNGSYFMGYFQPANMSGRNRADMLYLDANPGIPGTREFYASLAHELQHLINFSQTAAKTGASQDIWIDEGLATAAEYLYGGDPNHRKDYYNEDPRESIAYGNNFFVWDGYWEDPVRAGDRYDPAANYATAYLFFQWLRIHAGGNGIYKAIIESPYRDYRAVTSAAARFIDPSLSDWETLLKTWMLANVYNEPAGLFGYHDEIRTVLHHFTQTQGREWNFFPGEGVISDLDENPFNPNPDSNRYIRYVGLSKTAEVSQDFPYTGDYLLTFNANSDCAGNAERGYLAGLGTSRPPVRSAKRTFSSYPIDVRFNPDGSAP